MSPSNRAKAASGLGAMSSARREQLKENIVVNDVLNSVKIEKYFDLASRTLEAAEKSCSRALESPVNDFAAAIQRYKELNECYVYWKRFARLAIEVIPSHNYYKSPEAKEKRRRLESHQRSCLDVLEKIVQAMDNDEKFIQAERARRKEELERLEAERRAYEQARKAERAREAERQAREAERQAREAERQEAERRAREQERKARDEQRKAREAEEQAREAAKAKEEVDVKLASAIAATQAETLRQQSDQERLEAKQRIEEANRQQQLEQALQDEARPTQRYEPPAYTPTPTKVDVPYAQGDLVIYEDRGQWLDAVVLKVHYDDKPPYYTVKVGDAREVQTVVSKLRRRSERMNEDVDARLLGAKPLDQTPAASAPGSLDADLLIAPTPPSHSMKKTPSSTKKRSARELKQVLAAEWQRVGGRVESLPTYQGRVRDARGLDSTNGCAVIAPLVCYQHITSRQPAGATNDDIVKMIDTIVPPILAHIRAKHGLGHGAFIIPSDVHDYLYDQGAIRRDMFEGVYGGNVIDDAHLSNLVSALSSVPKHKRAAAAFFFKEHVTAILRVPTKNSGRFEYHFVDSMPGSRGGATRTVAPDSNALLCYLKFYALSKFGSRELNHIDSTAWSDMQAEFDPRVFQAFVWQFDLNLQ